MTSSLQVEWVIVVFYGPSAHRATYGRLGGTTYTKDFIQLVRTGDFVSELTKLFPPNAEGVAQLTYKWPGGSAPGQIVFQSADRPHLSWGTRLGAPAAWRMSLSPDDASAETIPGDPRHTNANDAESELASIATRGGGQPYLLAIKLRGEADILHLRTYLKDPDRKFAWASTDLLPSQIQELVSRTRQQKALAWARFEDAIHFEPDSNHDAWHMPVSPKLVAALSAVESSASASVSSNSVQSDDIIAEQLEVSSEEVTSFDKQIDEKNYSVSDTFATAKTRGSAQRAFAERVKRNYGGRCAVTNIATRDFLVAAHIVPWSEDHHIRLDPANGICLSLLMDRAFENGFLIIEDDCRITINWDRVGGDAALQTILKPYDGSKLIAPKLSPPRIEFLRRRRAKTDSKQWSSATE
jgi:HNH endonuclease